MIIYVWKYIWIRSFEVNFSKALSILDYHIDPPKSNLASLDSIFVQTGFSSRNFLNQRDELSNSKLSVEREGLDAQHTH